jgi:hypothetical protein
MIFTDDEGHSNAYDISTQEKQDRVLGDIVRQLGGDKNDIFGLDVDEAKDYLEMNFDFRFGRGSCAIITDLKDCFQQLVY